MCLWVTYAYQNKHGLFLGITRFLEFVHRPVDKVQKPSNSEFYTPSSEPFRIYMDYFPTEH
jgi:hypothetical protein